MSAAETAEGDGCSGGMSLAWRKLFGKPPPWEGCCHAHDALYRKGGTPDDRARADLQLLLCVAKQGHPGWAIVMYFAVRIGGHPFFPTSYRWEFDRPYSFGYREKDPA